MLKRLVFPIVVAACAGLALAQNDTGNKQPTKKDNAPSKAPASKKEPPKGETDKKEATLKVGDAAPALNVENWVKGDAVTGFEKGKVYVVEFWATWCPPCQKSIPHLTELQKQHKELTVLGVTSSERKEKDGSDNRLSKLQDWVKAKGDQMGYTVGYEGDYEMYKQWMTAAGRNGIPSAFVIGADGKIAWIGNPLDKPFDDAVQKALDTAKKTTDSKKDTKKDEKTTEKPKKNEKK